jgi:hypothetical protein
MASAKGCALLCFPLCLQVPLASQAIQASQARRGRTVRTRLTFPAISARTLGARILTTQPSRADAPACSLAGTPIVTGCCCVTCRPPQANRAPPARSGPPARTAQRVLLGRTARTARLVLLGRTAVMAAVACRGLRVPSLLHRRRRRRPSLPFFLPSFGNPVGCTLKPIYCHAAARKGHALAYKRWLHGLQARAETQARTASLAPPGKRACQVSLAPPVLPETKAH